MTMFHITRAPGPSLPRRLFLKASLLWPAGLMSAAPSQGWAGVRDHRPSFGKARRCIQVFLNGGPSQLDTWDMKPDAPAEIRGELKAISTNVEGIRVSELLPRMARLVERVRIVRSVTHTASVHTTGMYTMLTGSLHPTPTVDQTRGRPDDHPHVGSVAATSLGWRHGVPPFVCLPTLFRAPPVDGIWPGQTAGFLGRRRDPFAIEGDRRSARFASGELDLPSELTSRRLIGRRTLLALLGDVPDTWPAPVRGWSELNEQAWSLMDSAAFQQALDLEREPPSLRDRYGRHLFGQGLLLARR